MRFVPQHDWEFYRSIASQHDVYVERTPEERLEIYADFYNTIARARSDLARPSALDRQGWEEKLAQRCKFVAALQALDRWNRERVASDRSA